MHFYSRWKAILGYADHEITDDFVEWESRVPEEDRGRAIDLVQRSIRGEIEDYRVEFRMRHKDGSWRRILARAQATQRDAKENALRVVGTHTDIIEQVELRTQLIVAKESAEAAARAKAEFLATMSHEIRTPMNGPLRLARILLEGHLTDEPRGNVRSMLDSGSALLSVLNDVLDLSKAEAGMLEFEALPFRPLSCARRSLAHARRSRIQRLSRTGGSFRRGRSGVDHR